MRGSLWAPRAAALTPKWVTFASGAHRRNLPKLTTGQPERDGVPQSMEPEEFRCSSRIDLIPHTTNRELPSIKPRNRARQCVVILRGLKSVSSRGHHGGCEITLEASRAHFGIAGLVDFISNVLICGLQACRLNAVHTKNRLINS